MDYSSLKVVDLKRELKSRGLSSTGNKDELVERLNTYTQNLLGTGPDIDAFGESMNETDILDEDGVLGDELDYEDDEVLKKISSGNDTNTLDLPSDVSICSNNSSLNVTVIAASAEKALPPREPRNQQKSEKKVQLVRNRSVSVRSESDVKENDESKNDIDRETEANKSSEDPALKISLKSNVLSSQERLEQRKRKFCVNNEEDKKAARAARFGISNISNSSNSSNKKTSKIDVSADLNESIDALKQRAERFGLAVAPALAKTKALDALKSRAERFGIVSSPLLKRMSEDEKKEARKTRFLPPASSAAEEEKKKLRAQRFNIPT